MRRWLSLSRYTAMLAVIGILAGSIALLLYEGAVVVMAVVDTLDDGAISSKTAKVMAVGLIEAIDIFLIAIVANMIGQGLYKLWVDREHTLPAWLQIRDMDDLKSHLASSVIAVLAVLFMREAVAWDGQRNLLQLGAAISLIIVALTFFLISKKRPD